MVWIQLPSISEIEAMKKQRQKAIDSLEIIEDKYVRCQACGELKGIMKDDSKLISSANSRRIAQLKAMIKQIEREDLAILLKEEE
jgi:hypothetical protein